MTRTDIGLGMSGKETRSCHCRARARRLSYVRARRRVLSAIKTRPTEQPDTVLACPVPAVADWGSLATVSREETGGNNLQVSSRYMESLWIENRILI